MNVLHKRSELASDYDSSVPPLIEVRRELETVLEPNQTYLQYAEGQLLVVGNAIVAAKRMNLLREEDWQAYEKLHKVVSVQRALDKAGIEVSDENLLLSLARFHAALARLINSE